MKKVQVYTTSYCPYCQAAKALLEAEKIPYEEIDASAPDSRRRLTERTGRRTVPQIFFDEESIGGFDELKALHRSGELLEALK